MRRGEIMKVKTSKTTTQALKNMNEQLHNQCALAYDFKKGHRENVEPCTQSRQTNRLKNEERKKERKKKCPFISFAHSLKLSAFLPKGLSIQIICARELKSEKKMH